MKSFTSRNFTIEYYFVEEIFYYKYIRGKLGLLNKVMMVTMRILPGSRSKINVDNNSLSLFIVKLNISAFQCWEENPDIYGIRRSGRERKEPERIKVEMKAATKKHRKRSK